MVKLVVNVFSIQFSGYASQSPYSPIMFPKRQILDSSKLREFADDNFKFDGKDRKFSLRVRHCGKRTFKKN